MSLRWIVSAAAWAAFSAAVWFAGDLLAIGGYRPLEGTLERIVLIALLGATVLALEIGRARRAARDNEQLLSGLVGGSLDADSAERAMAELEVLRKRFQHALGVLKKARFRTPEGERRTISQLPWYMFIGAPGSGKTTALVNAGLRFPLGDPRSGEQALQGVGGTRNCDWWFTDEAVLVDTAGRYTTQESDQQADSAAWLGFLDLLKRFRPRQPLNGVIITLSIADLVHWNDDELARYAQHVRDRVGELYTRLGVRLPIYLLVTKADLLAGFTEFYSEFDAQQRAQVWGTTFASTEQARGLADRFKEEFGHLERRLYALLPGRLQETRDLQRRASIYRFPQQYRVAGPLIARFLEGAFGGEAPFLRGVYFTSGTQEGSPIDRVLATLARSFNLERKVQPPAAGAGKSYFLKRLLHEVIFGEAGLAGHNEAAEQSRRRARLAAYATFAVVTIAFALLWTASFVGNRSLVAAAEAKTLDAKRELDALPALKSGDEAKLIAVLNRLRELRDTVRGSDSGLLRAGFYQGDKLGAQADRAYRNALRDGLLAHAGVWQLPDSAKADFDTHLREALSER